MSSELQVFEAKTVEKLRRQIVEMLPEALDALRDEINSGKGAARVSAVRAIFEVLGQMRERDAPTEKDLSDLTSDELATVVHSAKRLMSDRARPIIDADDAPNAPDESANPLTLFD